MGGLGAAAVSLLGGILARPGGPRRGLAFAVLGLVLGLAVTAVPWTYRQTALSVPPIHDITTDTENPPRFEALLPLRAKAPGAAEYGGPAIAIQQLEAYPDIRPATLVLSPDQAFGRALAVAKEMGWTIVDAAEAEKHWSAAFKEAEGFGPQDPRLATSLNNLATVYQAQGNYAEAEPFYKRALAIREKA